MQKNSYRYEQSAALLLVEGYPDLSAGHGNEAIGILSAWRLQLIGTPELEGTRDHLESLMTAVMPYARHQLSGVGRRFGANSSFVSIGPMESGPGHQLELRSSREGVEPLKLELDDADLADLVPGSTPLGRTRQADLDNPGRSTAETSGLSGSHSTATPTSCTNSWRICTRRNGGSCSAPTLTPDRRRVGKTNGPRT